MISVHLLTVPAAVRGHDGTSARLDSREISGQVYPPQGDKIALGFSLIHAVRGAAVTHKVFGAGEHRRGLSESRALETADRCGAHDLGQLRILAEALVSAAPPLVAGDGKAGGERPADSGADQFSSC